MQQTLSVHRAPHWLNKVPDVGVIVLFVQNLAVSPQSLL